MNALPPDYKKSIGSDLIIPNYITQDPLTGAVGANFSGHVKASGIDLDGGPNSQISALQLVQWLRHTDGDRVAGVLANEAPSGTRSLIGAVFKALAGDLNQSLSALTVRSDSAPAQSYVQAVAETLDQRASAEAVILRADGASDFLQLAGTRPLAIAIGTASLTFLNSANSNQLAIAHGLPRIPALVGGFARAPTAVRCSVQESQAPDAAIYLTGYVSPGTAVNVTQNIYWFAIG